MRETTTFTPGLRFNTTGIVGYYVVKQLNETFEDSEFERLQEVKGNRTWREAVKEEFGVNGE